jgi:hypothetical protein
MPLAPCADNGFANLAPLSAAAKSAALYSAMPASPGSRAFGGGAFLNCLIQREAAGRPVEHSAPPEAFTLILTQFCGISGTEESHNQYIYGKMKIPVIGGLTQAEGCALGAYATSGSSGEVKAVPDLNTAVHGILLENGTFQKPQSSCLLSVYATL